MSTNGRLNQPDNAQESAPEFSGRGVPSIHFSLRLLIMKAAAGSGYAFIPGRNQPHTSILTIAVRLRCCR